MNLNEIYIYKTSLLWPENKIITEWQILSEDEKLRANRFVKPSDRQKFIAARATLRKLLGEFLGIEAKEIVFSESAYKKLELQASQQKNHKLEFNLSHSHDLALFAFAYQNPVGIDLEYIHPTKNFLEIAQKFFTKNEFKSICNLPKELQLQAFFNCWSRKEAFTKALGLGLNYDLAKFEIASENYKSKISKINLKIFDENLVSQNWSLFALNIDPNYASALAVAGNFNSENIHCFSY